MACQTKPQLAQEAKRRKIPLPAEDANQDTPPYLHDGRLLTLNDSVEFFNLVLGTKLTSEDKRDLVEFLRTL
jgi:cytochrome c peroxidase